MTGPTAAPARWSGRALYMVSAGVFVVAAIAAAYMNWIWWVPAYGGGLLIALVAATTLAVGVVVAVLGRWSGRAWLKRVALVVIAVGVGIVAGEALGPSREPLIRTENGTMTLRLVSPVAATATGPASCANVTSATEFSVSGDPNMRLDTPDGQSVFVIADTGDRWKVLRATPRKDGVWLRIDVTGVLVKDGVKPGTLSMQAAALSVMTSTFSNSGGSIRFAGLTAQTGPDFTGESMDLAGTLEWTCGAALVDTIVGLAAHAHDVPGPAGFNVRVRQPRRDMPAVAGGQVTALY